MNILIATDSFKGSLSAQEVGACIEQGFRQVFTQVNYQHMPLADGGEGMVEVLQQALGGSTQTITVSDPLGRSIQANWALLDQGQTALIEIAAASGLPLIAPEQRNVALASSYGTGQMIAHALDLGVQRIIIGLGGSATNDAGAGILQALGARLLDIHGNDLAHGGLALRDLDRIDLSGLHPRCREVELILACDVSSPLCGVDGASAVFGPQKGADADMVAQLELALSHFANIAAISLGTAHHNTPYFGAAGGAPLGLSLLGTVQLRSGIDVVLDALQADRVLSNMNLVITGEGQMDNQTLQGKVAFGIAQRAKAHNLPVIAIVGALGQDIDELYDVIDAVFDSVRAPQTLEEVLSEARENLVRNARNIAMLLHLGQTRL